MHTVTEILEKILNAFDGLPLFVKIMVLFALVSSCFRSESGIGRIVRKIGDAVRTVLLIGLLICTVKGCGAGGIQAPPQWNIPDVSVSEHLPVATPEPEQNESSAFETVNGNIPSFNAQNSTTESYEYYSDLDYLGRCGYAEACIGKDIMPTEERGEIGQVKPTGWHTVKYDCVEGKYLYNRCHLIGYQLTAENANEKNLITGTRYFNVQGMLPFENMVADYIKETGNHVMYRVTPQFTGVNLVADGVQMEAYSVEDDGEGVSFNVFVHNIQPSVAIDYYDGDSWEKPL